MQLPYPETTENLGETIIVKSPRKDINRILTLPINSPSPTTHKTKKKAVLTDDLIKTTGGVDEARTRDLLRDRQAF